MGAGGGLSAEGLEGGGGEGAGRCGGSEAGDYERLIFPTEFHR